MKRNKDSDTNVIAVDFAKKSRIKITRDNRASRIEALTGPATGKTGCKLWLGSRVSSTGYPQFEDFDAKKGSKKRRASRVVMELKLGRKLKDSEKVLHSQGCTKDCVNPAHLRIGTQLENMADAKAEGRFSKRLKAAEVLEVVRHAQTFGLPYWMIGERFGVSAQAIRNIMVGQSWGKVTGIEYVKRPAGRPKTIKLEPHVIAATLARQARIA